MHEYSKASKIPKAELLKLVKAALPKALSAP